MLYFGQFWGNLVQKRKTMIDFFKVVYILQNLVYNVVATMLQQQNTSRQHPKGLLAMCKLGAVFRFARRTVGKISVPQCICDIKANLN